MSSSSRPLLQSSLHQGILVLTVTQARIQGEEKAQTLRDEMRSAVEQAAITRVVVDLQHTRYLSSIAFWPLLKLRRQLLDAGGRLIICGLSGDVEDVFRTTRMISNDGSADAPFDVADDVAAAVARMLGEGR